MSKCESCYFCAFHSGGSWQAVAEGGDDPYAYWYCAKGHWSDAAPPAKDETYFDSCKDYRQKDVESANTADNT